MKRSAGVLMPVSSLDSEFGIGSFSKSAYDFVDWLKSSGIKYWQVLPLGPTGFGDSPYQSFSAFAGNPYFISLKELSQKGYISLDECKEADFGDNPCKIDYGKMYENRYKLLKKAFSVWKETEDFFTFERENAFWLEDYSCFMAIKNKINSSLWINWENQYKYRKNVKKDSLLYDEILFHKFLQYMFYTQWTKLKKYANDSGVKIIGDIPIYVSLDSSDAWSEPELFQFDDSLKPLFVAGCPPDGFSKKGQLWGNPLYDWDYHKKTNYEWWIKRFNHSLSLFDGVRIDHFRGFEKYYAIPYESGDATVGKWESGPSIDLFNAAKKCFENKVVIAEDLGFITESVRELVLKTGFMSTKVLEFAFDKRDNDTDNVHMPHNYIKNCASYTSTHDNETLAGWIKNMAESEKKEVKKYIYDFNSDDNSLYKSLIALAMRSSADLCIVPIQDILGLDNTARINTPSTTGNNWTWRMKKNSLDDKTSMYVRDMLKTYDRIS